MISDLPWPDTWTETRFGELFELKYGKALPDRQRRAGTIPVYGSNGQVGLHDVAAVPGPAIIVGRKGSVGKLKFEPGPCWPIDTTYFIDSTPLDWRFTFKLLSRLGLDQMDKSTAIPGLSRSDVYELRVAYPEPRLQAEIVTTLDGLDSILGSVADRLATIPVLLKKFRQSVLAAACSGQLTADWRSGELAEAMWKSTTVGEIADVNLGGTPSRKIPAYWGGEIPWVSSGEVAWQRITKTRESISENGLKHSNAKLMPVGTVLIAMIGEGKTRGQAAILDIPATTNQNVASLTPNAEAVSSQFLRLWAEERYETTRTEGGGGVQEALNAKKIRSMSISVPPLTEQAEIVRRVKSLFALADSIESRLAEATAQVERTTQAILAKAFRGEL